LLFQGLHSPDGLWHSLRVSESKMDFATGDA
jgi:hypothetical protein